MRGELELLQQLQSAFQFGGDSVPHTQPKKPRSRRIEPKIALGPGGVNYGKLARAFNDSESPMNLIIRGFIEIETLLGQLIARWMVIPDALKNNRISFADKLKLAVAIGALKEADLAAFKAFGQLRNDFAHHSRLLLTKQYFRRMAMCLSPGLRKFYSAWNFPKGQTNLERLSWLIYLLLFYLDFLVRARDRSEKVVHKKYVLNQIEKLLFPLAMDEKKKHPIIAPRVHGVPGFPGEPND